jgi:hypothetical protein
MRQEFCHEIPLRLQRAVSAARGHMQSATTAKNVPNFGPHAYGRLICQAQLRLRRQSQSGLIQNNSGLSQGLAGRSAVG